MSKEVAVFIAVGIVLLVATVVGYFVSGDTDINIIKFLVMVLLIDAFTRRIEGK